VVPGFIDGHTHFNSAGALVNDVNLMTVPTTRLEEGDPAGRRHRGPRRVDHGRPLGAYEEWALARERG